MKVRGLGRSLRVLLLVGLCVGCSPAALTSPTIPVSIGDPTADPATLDQTCVEAFGAWVALAEALNAPGADLPTLLFEQEQIQRRVFELCTLAEAERLNRDMPVELVPGVTQPLIQPDFRTFAEVECVDESPLLDGTPLCAEVGH